MYGTDVLPVRLSLYVGGQGRASLAFKCRTLDTRFHCSTTGALVYADTVKSGNANLLRVWNSLSKTVLATWCLSAKYAGGFTLTVASENFLAVTPFRIISFLSDVS